MKVKIYRGTKEIGGTCVEITADNGKILWIDLGSPLEDKNPNIDYIKNKVDALLISHPHQDHFGLMESIGDKVPIYIGKVSLDLINATRLFRSIEQLKGNFKTIHSNNGFKIDNTFGVLPFLVDHSTPEAFAFLIEVDGKRIFYSGDFRATGNINIVYHRLLNNPPPDINLLLIEGTMVERTNHLYESEEKVKEAFFDIIQKQVNTTFVVSSGQHSSRFIDVFKACKIAHKYLVIDIYTAWVLEKVRFESERVPGLSWKEIKVYKNSNQFEIIKKIASEEFLNLIDDKNIGNDVFKNPSYYVYFVRCPNEKLVNTLRNRGKINIIYSQWEGYLKEEHKTNYTDYLNILKNDKDIAFHNIHTSGHATVEGLMNLAKALNPKLIVPIHTFYPEIFKKKFEEEGFENVSLWEDGKEYQL